MGNNSTSTKLTNAIVEKIKLSTSNISLLEITLADIPHVTDAFINAYSIPKEEQTLKDKEILKISDEALEQIFWSDTIVIGLPMYNFGIPSALKAWIDHIARPGVTFTFSEKGAEGLITNKKVIIAISSGGIYTNNKLSHLDHTETYLRSAFGFLGMTDLTVYRAEGLAIPTIQDVALEIAIASIDLK